MKRKFISSELVLPCGLSKCTALSICDKPRAPIYSLNLNQRKTWAKSIKHFQLGKEEALMKFGSMSLPIPVIRALLVFSKDDAQSDALKWAAEKLSCECTMAYTLDEATESYQNFHPHIVFIDSRQSKTLDYTALCRSMHSIQGSQYSCFVAIVKKKYANKASEKLLGYTVEDLCGKMPKLYAELNL
ncbi:3',5'-cyclic-AMP phosphodiesterase [Caerostris extrusa]|uniref:3',5'-cyclic-AMP phosphodiesterase n=1 Tax=Caerostris extrusa TaxID=172846 RepID=A0AAV4Y8C0_CAEEX|nr:3',5'-cyclic-AMP phosphodiesterase [Caerostris extrusa]